MTLVIELNDQWNTKWAIQISQGQTTPWPIEDRHLNISSACSNVGVPLMVLTTGGSNIYHHFGKLWTHLKSVNPSVCMSCRCDFVNDSIPYYLFRHALKWFGSNTTQLYLIFKLSKIKPLVSNFTSTTSFSGEWLTLT